MNDESSKFPVGIDSPFNACMYRDQCRANAAALASQPAEQPRGEPVAWLYRSPAEIEFNKEPSLTRDAEFVRLMREVGGHEIIPLIPDTQPKAATDAHVGQKPSAWLSTWHDPLHEAERTIVADACEERARKRAAEVCATVEPLYTHIAPSQAVGAVDAKAEYDRGYAAAVQHMSDIWMDPSVRELRVVAVDMRHYLTRIGQSLNPTMREKWGDTINMADKRLSAALAGLRDALARPTTDQAVATAGDGVTPRYVATGHGPSDEVHRAANLLEKVSGRHANEASTIQTAVAYLRAYADALAQPRPMGGVPEEMGPEDDPKGARYRRAPERIAYRRGWNDCREAMLAAAPGVPRG